MNLILNLSTIMVRRLLTRLNIFNLRHLILDRRIVSTNMLFPRKNRTTTSRDHRFLR